VSYYSVCRESVSAFPTDPQGGTPVTPGDDGFTQVTVAGGSRVGVYGTNAAAFFIGSNGYLTFGQGDNANVESLAAHYNRPRVSALFDDLDPTSGGAVSWKQLSDRVAVTYLNVPEYQRTNGNSFQIELFFDGTLRLT